MNDNQEEAIDQFIRKATDQYQVSFDESHWKALEMQLNVEFPVVSPAGGLPYTLTNAVSILVTGFLIWIGGQEMVYSRYAHVAPNQEMMIEQNPAQESKFQDVPKSGFPDDDIVSEDTEQRSSASAIPPAKTSFEGATGERPESKRSSIALQVSDAQEKELYSGVSYPDRKSPTFKDQSKAHLPESLKFLDDEQQVVPAPIVRRKWNDAIYFGTVFAPELNSVGLASQKQLSGQVGISVHYELNRWLIGVRFLYNKKKYVAPGEEYSPPPGYWGWATNGVIPSEIDGWCNVIDVPILLGYNLTPSKVWNLIPQTGISTYWLTKENCVYSFEDPDYGGGYGWRTDENSTLFFAVANLSLAVRRSIGNRMTVQVEPYLKIPLGGVGWGKVDLYSTGTLITMSYVLAP